MNTPNPYSAPSADLSGLAPGKDQTYEPKLFAWRGRIGRLRYMAYLFAASLANMIPVTILMGVLGAAGILSSNQDAIVAISTLLYLPLLVLSFVLAKRRFNDVNRSGWFSLLLWVPLVNFIVSLYLVFARGDEGDNDFGPAPSPNTLLIKIVGLVFPVLFMVGIIGLMAAVTIPAYQSYVQKAQARSASQGL
ncbi:DUF805 domain-containing protein [Pseudoduganella aquatica]|uniref:DUF805 domain-containing protein n=1 Tax=Pseudoduganella aquatica TaxID=2660641 RepID=A0A7X4KR19_9BURK|nr:DUF805 domain-containing protein [Pseudoduganella aquatica]MYN10916.1 DUF805 domain-containing protein [Pseudoduganella aquatica]